ncbi:MAG: hypothetical protein IPQ07_41310 [Myxococcales bacterium]|nr:hypothetical protein [Myxococcales bacterium]
MFACLARIKAKKRVAYRLRVVDGLSFEEIAELVDASPEAVAKRVQHAQAELEEAGRAGRRGGRVSHSCDGRRSELPAVCHAGRAGRGRAQDRDRGRPAR